MLSTLNTQIGLLIQLHFHVKQWFRYLIGKPLYKINGIIIYESFFGENVASMLLVKDKGAILPNR